MNAKEMFENLGYVQKIYENQQHESFNGIQYVKKDPATELDRVGRVSTKLIEFYPSSKETLISETYERRNGTTYNSDSVVLSLEELEAVQTQMDELGWRK